MSQQAQNLATDAGMSPQLARRIEYSIIGLCIFAMVLIFQPFFKIGFSIGCVLVVVGGLAFNLVPLCQPGKPVRSVVKGGLIVLAIFVVVVLLALGSAHLYGVYLSS